MNSRMKKRLVVVTGVIIMVIVIVLAVVGGGSAAQTVTVAQAASGDFVEKRVQVSGNVVENSFKTTGNVLTFDIADPAGDPGVILPISYDGGVAATFGNDVTAICTGKIDKDGVLRASELVTKCPSKYESSSDALSVARLLEYGTSVLDKPVKVTGLVKADTLTAAGGDERFVLVDADGGGSELSVIYAGALSEEVKDGAALVLTGSVGDNKKFTATDVALKG
ncbi:MAG: cytochrome c maturation protein CcmE [Raoultibacter sp.]